MGKRTCSIDGCERWVHGQGLCEMHYRRLSRTGTTDKLPRLTRPRAELFVEKVRRVPDGCWIWTGAIGSHGYGAFSTGASTTLAHRWSYEHHVGAIPRGMFVLHRCDTPACVNPDHLFLGDNAANMADRRAKGRDCKMTPEQQSAARLRYAEGNVTQAELAREYGVCQQTIARVLGMRKRRRMVYVP